MVYKRAGLFVMFALSGGVISFLSWFDLTDWYYFLDYLSINQYILQF